MVGGWVHRRPDRNRRGLTTTAGLCSTYQCFGSDSEEKNCALDHKLHVRSSALKCEAIGQALNDKGTQDNSPDGAAPTEEAYTADDRCCNCFERQDRADLAGHCVAAR